MKNAKWVVGIRAAAQPYADWYQQRGWSRDGIVKTISMVQTSDFGLPAPNGGWGEDSIEVQPA